MQIKVRKKFRAFFICPCAECHPVAPANQKKSKEPKVVVLDNVAQFREYSAWRGALEMPDRNPW